MAKNTNISTIESKKLSKQKEESFLQRGSMRLSAHFSNFADKKGLARSIRSDEKEGPTSKTALPSKAII